LFVSIFRSLTGRGDSRKDAQKYGAAERLSVYSYIKIRGSPLSTISYRANSGTVPTNKMPRNFRLQGFLI
jgi:hypothetical protein